MRSIDRFVGIPLCWFLNIWKLFVPIRRFALAENNVKHVLVIKFFGMGSIILLTPALREIHKRFPNATISFLSFSSQKELLKRLPFIDSIFTISTSTFDDFLRDTINTVRMFKKMNFEIVFDFEFFSKFSTILSTLTNAPQRYAFALPTQWRKFHVTHAIPLNKLHHVAKAFLAQVSAETFDRVALVLAAPQILESDEISLEYSIKTLFQFEIKKKTIVCINVNAGNTFLERRWSGEKFVELAQTTFDDSTLYFFIGHSSEYDYVEQIVSKIQRKNVFNIAGKILFGELLALLRRARLLLTNDSGPLHLASALGTRTLSLFGPESPEFYGPIGTRNEVLYKKISCSPCMNIYNAKTFICPYSARCMKEISVEEVRAKINALL